MQPIPTWERRLSYFIWITHSLAAFVVAWFVSHGWLRQWIEHWLQPSPYIPGHKYDTADAEWIVFRTSVPRLLLANSFHSLGIFLAIRYAPKNLLHIFLLGVGVAGQTYVTSWTCVFVLTGFCVVITTAVYFTRSKILAYVVCIGFVIKSTDYIPFNFDHLIYYREFNVYLYGAIKILNFCLHLCNNPTAQYKNLWKDHFAYMGYLPYSLSLIVLFEDFRLQLHKRLATKNDLLNRSILMFGFRVAFWFLFYDLILHVIFVQTIYHSPIQVIGNLGIYSSQFFHVKYVVIFGLPSFFAYLDGMSPPPPPICISRVSQYSRMWRHFDRGLYNFLKHQVYIPIMKPPLSPVLSVLRALASLVAVFSIVIAWHGARPHYIAWVSLSALELIVERVGGFLWATNAAEKFKKAVGPQNSRRIVSMSMLCTVIPGIFGVFFFLGEEGVGSVVFNNVLIAGAKDIITFNIRWLDMTSAGFVLTHLLILGFFFNNVCLDLESNRGKVKIQ